MTSTTIPIPADIAKGTAPLLLGSILNWALYGGLCVQSYYYFLAFPQDRPILKGLVYGLLLIETAQSVLIVHDVFATFATGFGNIVAVNNPQLSWLTAPVMTGIVSCTVQTYFAHRIHKISGSKIVGFTIVLLAFMQGICAIVSGFRARVVTDITSLQAQTHTTVTIWLVGSAVCDIIIAVFMVYYLSRRASNFKATQALITKIMRLTIETGSLTATIAIVDLILFLAFPADDFHVAPALILGKLYTNTLLTALNSRLLIVNSRNDTSDDINSYRIESSGQTFVDSNHRMRVPGISSRTRKDDTTVTVNINREVWSNNIPMDRLNGQGIGRGKDRHVEEFV